MKFSIRTLLILTFIVALAVVLVPKYFAESATEIPTVWIDFDGGARIVLNPSQFDEMEALTNLLTPTETRISGELDDHDVELNYQLGMDHTCIYIKWDGDSMLFSKDNFVYITKAKPFQNELRCADTHKPLSTVSRGNHL